MREKLENERASDQSELERYEEKNEEKKERNTQLSTRYHWSFHQIKKERNN